jgi:hypothetical protein
MINPQILLGGRPAQINDPLDSATRMISLQEMMQQAPIRAELQQQQVQAGRQAIASQDRQMQEQDRALRDEQTVQAVLGETGGNLNAALPRLSGRISPKTFMGLQKSHIDLRNTMANINDKELATRKDQRGRISFIIGQALELPDDQYLAQYSTIAEAVREADPTLQVPDEPLTKDQLRMQRLRFMTEESYLKEEAEKRAKTEEAHKVAMRPSQEATAQAQATTAQQIATGTQPVQPAQREQMKLTERGQDMGAATARRGQDITVRGQNMSDDRARDLNQITRDNKPPTAGERHALGFYIRAANATKNLEALEGQMSQKGGWGQAVYAYAPNWAQSDENQKYRQAQREFTEARLRRDSGAAIPNSEFENDAKTYFPQPGDSATTLEEKRASRQQVLRALRIGAGNAMRDIGEEPGDMPQAPPPGGKGGATVRMVAPNGQMKEVPADQVGHFESMGAKRAR